MKKILKLTTLILITPSLFTFIFPHSAKANNQFDVCLRELTTAGVTTEQAQTGCADALVPRELSTCVRTIATATDIKAIDALKSCYQVRRPVDMGNCVVNINKNSILSSTMKTAMVKKEVETSMKPETETSMEASIEASMKPETSMETSMKTETETERNLFATTDDDTLTTKVSPVMMALSTCQASLLPVRHAECVIALSRTPQVTESTKAMKTCLSAEDFPKDLFPSYQ
jgi:hypothetical protein